MHPNANRDYNDTQTTRSLSKASEMTTDLELLTEALMIPPVLPATPRPLKQAVNIAQPAEQRLLREKLEMLHLRAL